MMINCYPMYPKPSFTEHQMVQVDMAHLGCPIYGIMDGEILGRSVEHVIDMWIIKFDKRIGDHPFKTICVPHTAIVHFWL